MDLMTKTDVFETENGTIVYAAPELGSLVPHHEVLDLDVVDAVGGPDDGPPHQRGEDVGGEVVAGIAALENEFLSNVD